MPGILVFFHCESNPGYAAASHEITFYQVAKRIAGSNENIHFAYPTLRNGLSPTLPKELTNIIEFDARSRSREYLSHIETYVRENNIQIAFGFDQPVNRLSHRYLRRGGVHTIISYLGAPMSSINHGLKLAMKKMYVRLCRDRPDHFIFQSEGMRRTATHGQGIPEAATSVVRTGIDVQRFSPSSQQSWYAHQRFQIPQNRRIIFFSGHMEERKGVDVIIRCAVHMIEHMGHRDIHFLIVGNKEGEEKHFEPLYKDSKAAAHITFGGYRSDIPHILKSCTVGYIASTVWDSFPMSSIEMAATGLPLVVSDLDGLREVISPETGFLYPPGNHRDAADRIHTLLVDKDLRARMSRKARQRAVREFAVDQQVSGLEAIIRKVAAQNLTDGSGLEPAPVH
ncbi:glycosyltransferase family 4 protein [Gilvimarinus sp. F26214L]|uniref:glycosyltransferase family 4 protein n=1 Tax=Gilvimarinus sp. DZF01 TaxID=3461371 RepID=UPI004045A3AA